jgi:predicted nucleic acid-binding protein
LILADTGAVLALIDADDRHHAILRDCFLREPQSWLLPWAILPEVDYLLSSRVGTEAATAFVADLAAGALVVEWGAPSDLVRAHEITRKYHSLKMGLVDALVLAMAERLRAEAIATLDLRHFGAVRLPRSLRLLPRDL